MPFLDLLGKLQRIDRGRVVVLRQVNSRNSFDVGQLSLDLVRTREGVRQRCGDSGRGHSRRGLQLLVVSRGSLSQAERNEFPVAEFLPLVASRRFDCVPVVVAAVLPMSVA